MRRFLNRLVTPLGLRVVKARDLEMVYQHEYSGGYDQYRDVQVHHNKRKIEQVWADEGTLEAIILDLQKRGLTENGICHGARNGFEVGFFREQLGSDVVGTDISETATDFPNMLHWDFHDDNPEWHGKFDFVYTNSLDQALEPAKALNSWVQQLKDNGCIYIEHTLLHGPRGAGEMDPFGAHPLAMPYLFFMWGREDYKLVDIIERDAKKNNDHRVWIFVLAKKGTA